MAGRSGVGERLPAELSSFVGRRRELAEIRRALGRTRLVTLIGTGGVGKTRLAYRVAGEMERTFGDGVRLAELADLRQEELLSQTVAAGVGLAAQSMRPAIDLLTDFLADKRLLLVLDNCEHLSDACANLVDKVLRAAPGVRVLATSRQPLKLDAEAVIEVPPLAIPHRPRTSPEDADQCEAMLLFADRAAAVSPDFAITSANRDVVAQLCRRLDGIPLAIELAAITMRSLSPAQVLDRLGDRFRLLSAGRRGGLPRHQTLSATIGWSHDLCSARERTLWRRTSVFTGGFDLTAVEQVCCDESLPRDDALDLITALVDKSIIVRETHDTGIRYRMLETIREYGRHLLVESGEQPSLRRRHLDYFKGLTERAEAEWFGPCQTEWLSRLQQEQFNLRAALEFCLGGPGRGEAGLEFVGALWVHWFYAGTLREGCTWIGRALAAAPRPGATRAKALWICADMAMLGGDLNAVNALLQECRAIAGEIDDEEALAAISHISGAEELYINANFPRAVALLEDGVARYRRVGVQPWAFVNRLNLSAAAAFCGAPGAQDLCTELLKSAEDAGARWCIAWALWANGLVAWRAGDPSRAAGCARKALQINRCMNNLWFPAWSVTLLAWAETGNGPPEHAARLLGCSRMLWRLSGVSRPEDEPLHPTGATARCTNELRRVVGARFTELFEEGAAMSFEEAIAYALDEKAATAAETGHVARRAPGRLSRRESQVASLVARGLSNKEIAAELVISRRTAEHHVERILAKLGFSSRTQIASWAGHTRRLS